jgi:hypothetical protein
MKLHTNIARAARTIADIAILQLVVVATIAGQLLTEEEE